MNDCKLISVTPDVRNTLLHCSCEQSIQSGQWEVLWTDQVLYQTSTLEYLWTSFMTLEISTTRGLVLKSCFIARSHIKNFHNGYSWFFPTRGEIPLPELRQSRHQESSEFYWWHWPVWSRNIKCWCRSFQKRNGTVSTDVGWWNCKECSLVSPAVPTKMYMTGSIPQLDSLHWSEICTWNSERTHGHCNSARVSLLNSSRPSLSSGVG